MDHIDRLKMEKKSFKPLKFRPTAYIFDIKQCIVVLYIHPANHAPGVQTGHTLGALSSIEYKWKNSKTMRPTAYIIRKDLLSGFPAFLVFPSFPTFS